MRSKTSVFFRKTFKLGFNFTNETPLNQLNIRLHRLKDFSLENLKNLINIYR